MQAQRSDKKPLELISFSNHRVKTLRTLKPSISCNDWKIPKAKIAVVTDGFRPILARDLFNQLGIPISQKLCPKTEVNTIEKYCSIKQSLAKELPELILRIDKSEPHTVNSKFHKNYCVTHQKGRKITIHLQAKVKIELKKLLNEGYFEKLSNCSAQFFISAIVITVKKDQ